jgi:2-dehydropantoate 2-reductase
MKIGIVGIGGVGGYFGGKLAHEYGQSGQHEIVFIARGEHLSAIKKSGLQLFTKEGDYVAKPTLTTDNPTEAGVFDLVFFGVKSYSLESSAKAVSGNISKDTVLIPLLNGVDIADRLHSILPAANIVNGCVYISSFIEKPGVVRQAGGICKLIFGTDDESAKQYQYILNILLKAKINAQLTDKISTALWIKYLFICPLAGLTTATNKTFGEIIENASLRERFKKMIKEVKSIADGRKIELPEDIVDKTLESIGRFAYDTKTSMQVDRERGKDTEIDIFTKYIIKSGKELDIPTPLHDEIYVQLNIVTPAQLL